MKIWPFRGLMRQLLRCGALAALLICAATDATEADSPYRDLYDPMLFPPRATKHYRAADIPAARREIVPLGIDTSQNNRLLLMVSYVFEVNLPVAGSPTSDQMSLLVVEDLQKGDVIARYRLTWELVDPTNARWYEVWNKAGSEAQGKEILGKTRLGALRRGTKSPNGSTQITVEVNPGVSHPEYEKDLERLEIADSGSIEMGQEEGFVWQSPEGVARPHFSGKIVLKPEKATPRVLLRYGPKQKVDSSREIMKTWRLYWDSGGTMVFLVEGEDYSVPMSDVSSDGFRDEDSDQEYEIVRERLQVYRVGGSANATGPREVTFGPPLAAACP